MVNRKTVHGIWKREGLTFPTRRRNRKIRTGQHLPLRAEYPNHIWTYDFIFDQTSQGTPLKILTLTDEFTRRSLAIRCGTAFTSMDVKAVLKTAFKTNGVPMILRSDNGLEFIAHDLGEWLTAQGVIRKHIDPGKPWQNGIAESFHSRFRDELLNVEVFSSPGHAQVLIDAWRAFYNGLRPHSLLSYRTPDEFAALQSATHAATTAVHLEQLPVERWKRCTSVTPSPTALTRYLRDPDRHENVSRSFVNCSNMKRDSSQLRPQGWVTLNLSGLAARSPP